MIERIYKCDVCGSRLPDTYMRESVPGGSTIYKVCDVEDVCEMCVKAYDAVDVSDAVKSKILLIRSGRDHCSIRPRTTSAADKKKAARDRLLAYRNKHGLGCLAEIADASGLFEDEVRNMLLGTVKLKLQKWEQLDAGLDKLEG